jgi:hypothetical protein
VQAPNPRYFINDLEPYFKGTDKLIRDYEHRPNDYNDSFLGRQSKSLNNSIQVIPKDDFFITAAHLTEAAPRIV